MYLRNPRIPRRRLGYVATTTANGIIVGAAPIGRAPIGRARQPIAIGPGRPVAPIFFGPRFTVNTNPASGYTGGGYGGGGYQGGGYGSSGSPYSNPSMTGGYNLAQLQQLYQTNPSALTPQQIQALQAAGTIAGTVPNTSGSLLTSSSAASNAIDPATGQTYASELAAAQAAAAGTSSTSSIGTTLDSTYAGLPLYLWLLIGGAGVFLLTGKRR